MSTQQYKCPSCGADMEYDTRTGMLHCDSCGRVDPIGDSGESVSTVNMDENYSKDYQRFDESETVSYECQNCGAVLTTEKNTTATICGFCGAPVVLGNRLQGAYEPTKIIPFKISKQEAQEAFMKWCKKGRLTPNDFKAANRVKSITGIYIPFWLFDLNVRAEASATATKVKSYTSGSYDVTETSYYEIKRNVDVDYANIPCDASEKMNDTMMDKLEPFNYGDMVNFNMPYLAGYLAENYDYDGNKLLPRIKKRADEYVESYIRSTITGYSTVTIRNKVVNINNRKDPEYTLLPIWTVAYDYENAEHNFVMNGQTGKIVGKPPISKGKVAAWFAGVTAGAFAVFELAAALLRLGGVI